MDLRFKVDCLIKEKGQWLIHSFGFPTKEDAKSFMDDVLRQAKSSGSTVACHLEPLWRPIGVWSHLNST